MTQCHPFSWEDKRHPLCVELPKEEVSLLGVIVHNDTMTFLVLGKETTAVPCGHTQ